MPLSLRVLLILLILAMLVNGVGYDPLALLVPGVGVYALPSVLMCIAFFVLVRRSGQLEKQVHAVSGRLEALRAREQTTWSRSDPTADRTTQLTDEMHDLRQMMAQHKLLLPGRLLLLQQRYEDAARVLQEAVADHPEHAEARWLLGEALFHGRRYSEALPHLLAGLVDDDGRCLGLVAQCEQALGRYADAEAHLLRLIETRDEPRQEDLVALGSVQSELDPERARQTLTHALELNPYNSVVRYQLIELETRTGAYEQAIELATEGLQRNAADVGCFVSRADAYFRRGRPEDDTRIFDDLATAQARNRKDYNIYRLCGALHQRQASDANDAAASQQALQDALEVYEQGLANVPPKFHAHLLAAESRVLLQLQRFEEAAERAQRAVNHYQGHVSNHLALAFARLATQQWQAAVKAADRGMQWAGWGGRIWLTAVGIFARLFGGTEPTALRQKCAALAADLKADARHFALSESWSVVRAVLQEKLDGMPTPCRALVQDTIALLEQDLTPEQYHHRWVESDATEKGKTASRAAGT
ncbi:hypothetical protein NKDENANG_03203 [Candidatus Entotheonellaceae bacterium PAL068K]